MEKILVVDDNPRLVSGVRVALEMHEYQVLTADNGVAALDVLRQTRPDLIISDIMMPTMDGFAFLERVQANPAWATIPFLFVTALSDAYSFEHARVLGADAFISKPFSPRALVRAVRARLDRAATMRDGIAINASLDTLYGIAQAVALRDGYPPDHLQQMSAFALAVGRQLGWDARELFQLRLAAMMHDLGKVMVPSVILEHPDNLTAEQQTLVQRHPVDGAQMLERLHADVKLAVLGVRHHHEMFDGRGYPNQLAGENIPVIARIVTLADMFSELLAPRPTRRGIEFNYAIVMLDLYSGRQLDPELVRVFKLLCTFYGSPAKFLYQTEQLGIGS